MRFFSTLLATLALGSCALGLEERAIRYVLLPTSPEQYELIPNRNELIGVYARALDGLDARDLHDLYRRGLQFDERDLFDDAPYLTTRDLGELDARDLSFEERDLETDLYTRDALELDEREMMTDLYARHELDRREAGIGKIAGKMFRAVMKNKHQGEQGSPWG